MLLFYSEVTYASYGDSASIGFRSFNNATSTSDIILNFEWGGKKINMDG